MRRGRSTCHEGAGGVACGSGGAGAVSGAARTRFRAAAVARKKPALPPTRADDPHVRDGTVQAVSTSQTGAPVLATRAAADACGSTPKCSSCTMTQALAARAIAAAWRKPSRSTWTSNDAPRAANAGPSLAMTHGWAPRAIWRLGRGVAATRSWRDLASRRDAATRFASTRGPGAIRVEAATTQSGVAGDSFRRGSRTRGAPRAGTPSRGPSARGLACAPGRNLRGRLSRRAASRARAPRGARPPLTGSRRSGTRFSSRRARAPCLRAATRPSSGGAGARGATAAAMLRGPSCAAVRRLVYSAARRVDS